MNDTLVTLLDSYAAAPALLIVKATVLLFMALVVTQLLGRSGAAARHLVWTVALGLLLVLPLAARLPRVELPLASVSVSVPTPSSYPLQVAATSAESSTGASEAPATVPSRDTSIAELLAALWAAGAVAVVGWLLVGRALLHRVRRRAERLAAEEWRSALHDAAWLLELRRSVALYCSDAVSLPVTWGVLRPVVVLPASCGEWDAERRRVVLLHELSHVARHDSLTQLMALVACAVWWFHPGAWYAARRMRIEREHACDARVLAAGTRGADYAAHLLALAQQYRSRLRAPLVALHMARPGQLEGRLLRVLAGGAARTIPTRRAAFAGTLALVVLTLPLSALQPIVLVNAAAGEPVTAADSLIERTLPARAGGRLLLDLRTGGEVEVTGWNENRVHVRAILDGPDRRGTAVEIRESDEGVDIVAWQRDSRADYRTTHRFEVRVPRRYGVQLRSSAGSVLISGVTGSFRGHTADGGITLARVEGDAELTTGNGGIAVQDSRLSGRVTTAAGTVSLRNVSGALRGSSGSGSVVVDAGERGAGSVRADYVRIEDGPRTAAGRAEEAPRPRERSGSLTVNGDSVASITQRVPLRAARHAIVSQDGFIALLLRDTSVVLQYTDAGLDHIGRSEPEKDGEGFLGSLVSGMLRGGLRTLLDRAIEYSLYDLKEARYDGGRLLLLNRQGSELFGEMNINNGPVMEQFSERDARTFAQRVNATRARLRR